MNLTARLSRRLAAGVGLASAAILLPTAALASSASAGSPAHPSHPAIAGCIAAKHPRLVRPAGRPLRRSYLLRVPDQQCRPFDLQLLWLPRGIGAEQSWSPDRPARHPLRQPDQRHARAGRDRARCPGRRRRFLAVQQPRAGHADQGLPAWPVPLPVGAAGHAGLHRQVRAPGGLRSSARRNPQLLDPVDQRSSGTGRPTSRPVPEHRMVDSNRMTRCGVRRLTQSATGPDEGVAP